MVLRLADGFWLLGVPLNTHLSSAPSNTGMMPQKNPVGHDANAPGTDASM
jgi:hypothetical protein